MNVVIIVPIYKSNLNVFEQIALNQLFSVLGKYDICLVIPANLKTFCRSHRSLYGHSFYCEVFHENYFNSKSDYSRLLLSTQFYERFIRYEYMLIYQLDAFVFFDRLLDFIKLGYDYIGAPLISEEWKYFHVGNGGLSLRNVKKCLYVSRQWDRIVLNHPQKKLFQQAEDYYFAYCGYLPEIDFSTPDPDTAALFAVQDDSFGGMSKIEKRGLPFGMHLFPMNDYCFWKPVIESYGYVLPPVSEVFSYNTLEGERKRKYDSYFMSKLPEISEEVKRAFFKHLGLNTDSKIILWGAGKDGKFVYDIFYVLNVHIEFVFDSKQKRVDWADVAIFRPNYENITKCLKHNKMTIIISSGLYDKEISGLLQNYGFCEDDGYVTYNRFINSWQKVKDEFAVTFPYIKGVTTSIVSGF